MSEWEAEASYQHSRRIAAEGERDDWRLEADILQGKIDGLEALLDRALEALRFKFPLTDEDRALLRDAAALKGDQGD